MRLYCSYTWLVRGCNLSVWRARTAATWERASWLWHNGAARLAQADGIKCVLTYPCYVED